MKKKEPYYPGGGFPRRGSSDPCPVCGIAAANQHTLGESAKCDGIKKGYLDRNGKPILRRAA